MARYSVPGGAVMPPFERAGRTKRASTGGSVPHTLAAAGGGIASLRPYLPPDVATFKADAHLKLPKLRSRRVIESSPELSRAIKSHPEGRQFLGERDKAVHGRTGGASIPCNPHHPTPRQRGASASSSDLGGAKNQWVRGSVAGIPDQSHHGENVDKDAAAANAEVVSQNARLQTAHNDAMEARKQRESALRAVQLEWKNLEKFDETAAMKLAEMQRRAEADKSRTVMLGIQNQQFHFILDRLNKDRGKSKEALAKQQSVVKDMDDDLAALKQHLREVQGAAEHANLEKLGVRERFEVKLEECATKLRAQRAEADRNRLNLLAEQEAYAEVEKAQKIRKAQSELARKGRLDQAERARILDMLVEKNDDEMAFHRLCEAARCDPSRPQEMVDIYVAQPGKRRALRENKEQAIKRLAELREDLKVTAEEEKRLFGGGSDGVRSKMSHPTAARVSALKTFQGANGNPAEEVVDDEVLLERAERARDKFAVQAQAKEMLIARATQGLFSIFVKLGLRPDSKVSERMTPATSRSSSRMSITRSNRSVMGTRGGARVMAHASDPVAPSDLPKVLDKVGANLERMMTEAGIELNDKGELVRDKKSQGRDVVKSSRSERLHNGNGNGASGEKKLGAGTSGTGENVDGGGADAEVENDAEEAGTTINSTREPDVLSGDLPSAVAAAEAAATAAAGGVNSAVLLHNLRVTLDTPESTFGPDDGLSTIGLRPGTASDLRNGIKAPPKEPKFRHRSKAKIVAHAA